MHIYVVKTKRAFSCILRGTRDEVRSNEIFWFMMGVCVKNKHFFFNPCMGAKAHHRIIYATLYFVR